MARIQPRCWCCSAVAVSQYCVRCHSCTPTLRACGATTASINWPDPAKAVAVPRRRSNYSPPKADCECPSCGAHVAEGVRHTAPVTS